MIEIIGMQTLRKYIYTPGGDKSISHRIALMGALANDYLQISNYSQGKDCETTLKCLKQIGVNWERNGESVVIEPWQNKNHPKLVLDSENSGTTARLLPAVLGGLNISAKIVGDQSLSLRPMDRLVEPLEEIGATLKSRDGKLPLEIEKNWNIVGKKVALKVASAQIKSALLLAALFGDGVMEIKEPAITRDHTEIMFKEFGVNIKKQNNSIFLKGGQKLVSPKKYRVVGDFSSSVYFIALGILAHKKIITIKNVGLNQTRTAFLEILESMGAEIIIKNQQKMNGEIMGDLEVYPARDKLHGVTVPEKLVANLIDELPLIAVLGAFANGKTKVTGAKELRFKESDRISAIVSNLASMGANIVELEDGFEVIGGATLTGTQLDCYNDHRIIMSMAIAALFSEGKTTIIDSRWVKISNSSFFESLKYIAPDSIYL